MKRLRIVALVLGTFALLGACRAQVVPVKLNPVENIGIDQKLGSQVPLDLHFRDEKGTDVALRQFFGQRPVVLMLVFYRCHQMCAVELDAMMQTVGKLRTKRLGKDYDLLCVSIDPKEGPTEASERRTAVLAGLKIADTPQAGWHFLTGDLDSIDKLATSVGFRFAYDAKTNRINHPGGVMFLTPKGVVSKYIYGATYPSIVFRDSLAQAAKSKVGEKSEVFLFGCIVMDPNRPIRAIVETVVGIAGLLTVVGIGFWMVRMNRQASAAGAVGGRGATTLR